MEALGFYALKTHIKILLSCIDNDNYSTFAEFDLKALKMPQVL